MFRQIISNLSLSPAAGQQLTFYFRRLQREQITRTLSVISAVGLMFMQVAATIVPPTSVNAASSNDIIRGGIGTKHPQKTLLNIYDNDREIRALFNHYGVNRNDIKKTKHGTLSSSNKNFKSLGRNPHSELDRRVSIGGKTYYLRPLHSWGTGVTYKVLEGRRHGDNRYFAIMINCGNLVLTDTTPEVKAPSPPQLNVSKAVASGPASGAKIKPGQEVTFRLRFNNSGKGAANDVVIGDRIPNEFEFISQGDLNVTGAQGKIGRNHTNLAGLGGEPAGFFAYWKIDKLNPKGSGYGDIKVRLKSTVKDGLRVCNRGFIDANGEKVKYSNQICYSSSVIAPATPAAPTTPPATPAPTPAPTTAPTAPTPLPQAEPTLSPDISLQKSAVIITVAGQQVTPSAALARAGDSVKYTLSTSNTGLGAQSDYEITEEINDILEYADVADAGGAVQAGGTLKWPKVDIPAGSTVIKTFTIRVKSPLPTTPASSSDPQSFDLIMDNIYGNAVSVKLEPPTTAKQVETASAQLPQTGPIGNTIAFAFIALAVYFYFRNRQLVHEVAILRHDYQGGGR
ncbi:MAG TPA: hypothetical protein VNA68_02445 [Candidatus Dormibacteraeota bacterium]|nr:hypothetical protein [Candidatus Dormibacteraeota bacterium]